MADWPLGQGYVGGALPPPQSANRNQGLWFRGRGMWASAAFDLARRIDPQSAACRNIITLRELVAYRADATAIATTLQGEEIIKGFIDDISDLAVGNAAFRRVLYTGQHLQLVLMTLKPGQEIGTETHKGNDQFFRVEKGQGEAWIDGNCTKIRRDDAVLVPAGALHNIVNTGSKSLRFYTLYSPPHHRDGVVRKTRADADSRPEHFDGDTTEKGPQAAAKVSAKSKPDPQA